MLVNIIIANRHHESSMKKTTILDNSRDKIKVVNDSLWGSRVFIGDGPYYTYRCTIDYKFRLGSSVG